MKLKKQSPQEFLQFSQEDLYFLRSQIYTVKIYLQSLFLGFKDRPKSHVALQYNNATIDLKHVVFERTVCNER